MQHEKCWLCGYDYNCPHCPGWKRDRDDSLENKNKDSFKMDDLKIIKRFLNDNFEAFQEFLSEELELEPTEAEVIIGRMEAADDTKKSS